MKAKMTLHMMILMAMNLNDLSYLVTVVLLVNCTILVDCMVHMVVDDTVDMMSQEAVKRVEMKMINFFQRARAIPIPIQTPIST